MSNAVACKALMPVERSAREEDLLPGRFDRETSKEGERIVTVRILGIIVDLCTHAQACSDALGGPFGGGGKPPVGFGVDDVPSNSLLFCSPSAK